MVSRVTTARLFRNLLLLLFALSGVLSAANRAPGDSDRQDSIEPQASPEDEETPSSDVELTPTSIGTYIAELFGTLAGLAWGLYASLPSFG